MKILAPALAVVLALLAAGVFFVLRTGSESGTPELSPEVGRSTRTPDLTPQEGADGLPHFPSTPAVTGGSFAPWIAPPGLVRIAGGQITIGADTDEIRALIGSTGLRVLASETPQHTVALEDFALMPTEVTNEQYLAFVEATGAKPPQSWAEAALSAAGLAHATEAGKVKKEARDNGFAPPKTQPFDGAKWWSAHWQTSEWAVPQNAALLPVVFVDFDGAAAYAQWAGLWLMSQEEFQAAGRGASAAKFPWGDDEVSDTRANTIESNRGAPAPVASFPGGAAWIDAKGHVLAPPVDPYSTPATGIFDLAGNVWEWTRSPFLAYPGFEPLEVELPTGTEHIVPAFEAKNMTVGGGGFSGPSIAARLTTRRNTATWQATDGVGFRCSAPLAPGALASRLALQALDLTPDQTFSTGRFDDFSAASLTRWTSSTGSSPTLEYRVITGFDKLLFIPAQTRETLVDETVIGLLQTSLPLTAPALEPGTYSIMWHTGNVLRFYNAEEGLVCELECEDLGPGYIQKSQFRPDWNAEATGFVDIIARLEMTSLRIPLTAAPGALAGDWQGQ